MVKRYQKKTIFFPNWTEEIYEKKVNEIINKKITKNLDKKKLISFLEVISGKLKILIQLLKLLNIQIKKQKNLIGLFLEMDLKKNH